MTNLSEIKTLILELNKNLLDAISKMSQGTTDTSQMAAAKIITELSAKIDQKEDTKNSIEKQPENSQDIITTRLLTDSPSTTFQYSYPNFSVGNENLGKGKAKGSLTWPFKTT